MENNKSEPSSQRSKNLIFIGATGAGKSSTCNTLLGTPDHPFPVGHDELSCTSKILIKTNKAKKIRLIDTPDYRDNRYDSNKIDDVREAVAAVFDKNATDHSKRVDAFVLVVKVNPRVSSLREDLKHVKHLFGTSALRSVLLLLINHGSSVQQPQTQDFLDDLKSMEPVKKVLMKAKGERPNENWFCYWDNINPIPGQEEQLMEKIGNLEPYTHEKFVEGKKEVSLRRSMLAETQMETEIERIRNSYISEGDLMTRRLNELDETIKKEKKELIEARDRALENVNQVLEAMRLLDERANKGIDKLYGVIAREREETVKKCMDIIKVREEGHGTNIDQFLKENREILERFQRHVGQRKRELEKEVKDENDEKVEPSGEKKKALTETALKGAEKLVKKSAGEIASKTAEEIAKLGAQEIVKTGMKKVVARIVCNVF